MAASPFGRRRITLRGLTRLKSGFCLQRSGVDAVPDEGTGLRSGTNQGNVGAAHRQPLREQLWRSGEAAEQYRGPACRTRLRQRPQLSDQRTQARAADRDELHDPARALLWWIGGTKRAGTGSSEYAGTGLWLL